MSKQDKVYTIVKQRDRKSDVEFTGTLEYFVKECFGYTLDCGASYQHEKGNKKIDRNPKTIDGLIKNLNNAVNNSASNGYAGTRFVLKVA